MSRLLPRCVLALALAASGCATQPDPLPQFAVTTTGSLRHAEALPAPLIVASGEAPILISPNVGARATQSNHSSDALGECMLKAILVPPALLFCPLILGGAMAIQETARAVKSGIQNARADQARLAVDVVAERATSAALAQETAAIAGLQQRSMNDAESVVIVRMTLAGTCARTSICLWAEAQAFNSDGVLISHTYHSLRRAPQRDLAAEGRREAADEGVRRLAREIAAAHLQPQDITSTDTREASQ